MIKMCKCGKPSITGLKRGVAICQHDLNRLVYGKKRANQIAQGVKLLAKG